MSPKTSKRLAILWCFPALLLCGCQQSESIPAFPEEFEIYYQWADETAMKGLELYCWKVDEKWFSGILGGTNRQKDVEEVKSLQDEYPCPVETMADIIAYIDERVEQWVYLKIVSLPPTSDELASSNPAYEGWEYDYAYLLEALGLPDDGHIGVNK